MKNVNKYTRGYFLPPVPCRKWVEKEYIEQAPTWCSVDLRDGNQALVVPMSLEDKLAFFQFLVKVGFKEIEVGFPAASETEYAFLRALIEQNLIPEDVTVQVLTQAREHIIQKTYEALRGVKQAIVHVYNSTSVAQREQVFKKSKEDIIKIAVEGAKMVQKGAETTPGDFRFEYSPESFSGTEMEFALDICNAVLDVWQPTAKKPVIINLPVTVSYSMPHIYAGQVEYMSDHLNHRDNVILSLHPHNDRGCAVADAEMGVLAGGQRVEGTLFGNGERTGNLDIVTMALNMFSQGVDPKLNFENIPEIIDAYEQFTGMTVYERQPYSGKLVFAAFSGSHQDAIAKGMHWREEKNCPHWSVPYLLIDPKDIGREYDGDVIRINSQSGKGGIGYLLEQKYGFHLPKPMAEHFGYHVKSVSDHLHKELTPENVYDIFTRDYVNITTPVALEKCEFDAKDDFHATITVQIDGKTTVFSDTGNGRFDAISNALQKGLGVQYDHLTYHEHALETGSQAKAAAYVSITSTDGDTYYGVGIHQDIMTACAKALVSAVNQILAK